MFAPCHQMFVLCDPLLCITATVTPLELAAMPPQLKFAWILVCRFLSCLLSTICRACRQLLVLYHQLASPCHHCFHIAATSPQLNAKLPTIAAAATHMKKRKKGKTKNYCPSPCHTATWSDKGNKGGYAKMPEAKIRIDSSSTKFCPPFQLTGGISVQSSITSYLVPWHAPRKHPRVYHVLSELAWVTWGD